MLIGFAVLPQILQGSLGYDVGTAQCLIAPPYVFAGMMVSSALQCWSHILYCGLLT